MKNLSIKLQLTIWYSLIILVISIVLFISFYVVTQRSILTETDRSLLSHASSIAENIGLNTNNIFDDQTEEIVSVSKIQIPGIFLEVTDINGHVIKNEEVAQLQDLTLQAIQSKTPVYSNRKLGVSDLRIIAFPINNRGQTIGAVVMGHPVDVYTNALVELKKTLLLLTLFFIAPSIAIGYILSQNAPPFRYIILPESAALRFRTYHILL